jgi:hypothetical protein
VETGWLPFIPYLLSSFTSPFPGTTRNRLSAAYLLSVYLKGMTTLGINIGSTSIKMAEVGGADDGAGGEAVPTDKSCMKS